MTNTIFRKTRSKTPEGMVKEPVRKFLRNIGFFVFHIQQGMGSYPGIADLYAIKKGVGIWIEIKVPNNPKSQQSPKQVDFEANITSHGGEYIVVRSVEYLYNYLREKHPEVL